MPAWLHLDTFSRSAKGGKCFTCGSSQKLERGVFSTKVPFGEDRFYEGDIEICGRCVMEAAEAIGALSPETAEKIRLEHTELQAWADETYATLAAQEQTIATLAAVIAQSHVAA